MSSPLPSHPRDVPEIREKDEKIIPRPSFEDDRTSGKDEPMPIDETQTISGKPQIPPADPQDSPNNKDPPPNDGDPPASAVADLEAARRTSTGRPVHSVFSKRQKQYIVFMASWAGFFSPLSANIYFPALNTLAAELRVSSEMINLTLTSYMIFQGLAPTVFGDLADMAGRRPTYLLCFLIYIAANIGLALQSNYAALLVLRCLQSSGSSGTVALANGVVADVASSSERGTYMGYAMAGPMVGPAIGPVLGGVLAQFLGWKAIFWFLAIMAAVFLVPFLLSFPETGRNVVGNGSVPPPRWDTSLLSYLKTRHLAHDDDDPLTRTRSRSDALAAQAALSAARHLRFPNPLKTIHIILEKDVGLILLYNALVYTAFYDVISTIPLIFAQLYNFNDLQIGLCFIPFGIGCSLASLVTGPLIDRNYRRVAAAAGIAIDRRRGEDMRGFPIERARLQVAWPLLGVGAACMACYGWVLQREAPLAAPLVLHFLMGLALTGAFNIMSILLVDLYPSSPATATAANNLCRCLMGAAGTGVVVQMVEGMGRGWCFTFVAGVVVVGSPMLWVVQRRGMGWREERRVRVERREKEKEGERERRGRGEGMG
ncbi:hypothetical protein MMC17_006618 [Xylographa soralifera]|nr:hypothetical protein [Xylographa soralifera]